MEDVCWTPEDSCLAYVCCDDGCICLCDASRPHLREVSSSIIVSVIMFRENIFLHVSHRRPAWNNFRCSDQRLLLRAFGCSKWRVFLLLSHTWPQPKTNFTYYLFSATLFLTQNWVNNYTPSRTHKHTHTRAVREGNCWVIVLLIICEFYLFILFRKKIKWRKPGLRISCFKFPEEKKGQYLFEILLY